MAKRKSLIIKAKKALLRAAEVVYAYRPISNKGEPYTEMVEYAVELRTHLLTQRNELDTWLIEIGAKTEKWEPVQEGWRATDWAANWADAAEKCCLSRKDGGVAKHLAAYEKAVADAGLQDAERHPAGARAARIKGRDRLQRASNALTNVYLRSAEFPGLRAYVDRWLEKVTEWSKNVGDELEDTGPLDDHPGMKEGQKFTPDGWSACFHEAARQGYLSAAAGDKGLTRALAIAERRQGILDRMEKPTDGKTPDPRKLARQRARVIAAEAEVNKASLKIAEDRSNRNAPVPVKKHLADVSDQAKAKAGKQLKIWEGLDFTRDAQLTPKAWAITYKSAVQVGAVPPKLGAEYFGLERALKKYRKAQKVFAEKTNAKARMKAARKLVARLHDVTAEIKTIEITPGYDQPNMVKHLEALKDKVGETLKEKQLTDVLSGQAGGAFKSGKLPRFDWNAVSWRKIKDEAVALGILPSADTGMLSAFKECSKTHARWIEAKEPETKDKARRKSMVALAKLSQAVVALQAQCQHPAMQDYLEVARHEVIARLEARTREG